MQGEAPVQPKAKSCGIDPLIGSDQTVQWMITEMSAWVGSVQENQILPSRPLQRGTVRLFQFSQYPSM
jgi:hypothetical protein